MGYVYRKLGYSNRTWRVGYQRYEKGIRLETHVSEERYRELGLSPSMTEAEVRARIKELNVIEKASRREERRQAVMARLGAEQLSQAAHIPAFDEQEFVKKHVTGHKALSHWRAAKRVIAEVSIDVSDWADEANTFFRHFAKQNISMSYVQKLLPYLNRWGMFVAKRHNKAFLPIPWPTGINRARIEDAYYSKRPEGGASDPLTPEKLESGRCRLKNGQYHWLYISVWTGLRVHEVDLLCKPSGPKTWWLEKEGGVDVLWVYQSKLTSVAQHLRTKPIPLFLPEQKKVMEILHSKDIQRPLAKTLKKVFTERTTCMAGRKGFVDLMLSRGQSLEDISVWLGHRSIERTWRNYKNKQKVSWKAA